MNIFETLGPKLRKAILLTESNRAMREMLKGNIHPMALQRKGMLRPAERMERGYLKGVENKRAKHGIRDLDYAEQHAMGLPYNKPGYAVNRQPLADHTTDADTPKRVRKATRKFLRNNPNDKGWTHTLPGNESVVRGHETDELLSKAKSHATIGAKKRGDKQPMQIGSHRGLDVLGKEMQDTARLKAHGSSMGDRTVTRLGRTIAQRDNTLKVIPERSVSLQGERHKTGEYDLVRRKAGMDPKSSLVGPQEMRKLRNARHDVPGAFVSQPPERPVVNTPMARKAAKMKRRQLRAVSKGLASKYGDKFMQMRGDKPNYADRFGNIPESAVARAGNLQEARVGGYKFSSTQVALPIDLAQKIMAYGKQIVKDQDLADDGRDEHPHITIKYGLHTNDPKLVARALRGVGPIKYKLGAVSKFEAAEYDVLKIAVISDDLRRVNMRLRKLLKCTDTHPIYNPHVTIAYVRKGFPLPRPSDVFDGAMGVADVVEFSAKNGKMHKLKLAQRHGSV